MQDHELDSFVHGFDIKTVQIPEVQTLSRAWWIKSQLLRILPEEYQTVLYIDSDIVVTRALQRFFAASPSLQDRQLGVFFEEDARTGEAERSHHGGVVLMQRAASEPCLQAWSDKMSSLVPRTLADGQEHWGEGEVLDDQDAMDFLANEGNADCQFMPLPKGHLLFAADFWALALRWRPVFVHVTHTARKRYKGRFGWFHRTTAFLMWGYSPAEL